MIICINEKRLRQVLGYGFWGLITMTLVVFGIASYIELNNQYFEEGSYFDKYCHDSVLFEDDRYCYDIFDKDDGQQFWLMFIPNIINIIIIGGWIYFKQNRLRFELCEKTGVKKNV